MSRHCACLPLQKQHLLFRHFVNTFCAKTVFMKIYVLSFRRLPSPPTKPSLFLVFFIIFCFAIFYSLEFSRFVSCERALLFTRLYFDRSHWKSFVCIDEQFWCAERKFFLRRLASFAIPFECHSALLLVSSKTVSSYRICIQSNLIQVHTKSNYQTTQQTNGNQRWKKKKNENCKLKSIYC